LKENGVVKAYGGAQQVRATVPGMCSGEICCAAKKMIKLQRAQMIATVTVETVQMLCFHMCTATSPKHVSCSFPVQAEGCIAASIACCESS